MLARPKLAEDGDIGSRLGDAEVIERKSATLEKLDKLFTLPDGIVHLPLGIEHRVVRDFIGVDAQEASPPPGLLMN